MSRGVADTLDRSNLKVMEHLLLEWSKDDSVWEYTGKIYCISASMNKNGTHQNKVESQIE